MNEKLSLSIGQFRSAWRVMCAAAPNSARASMPGMELLFSRIPIPFFNVVVLTDRVESSSSLGKLAKDACAAAAEYAVPWFLVVTYETLAKGIDAAATLKECGLAPLVPLTGMIADDVEPRAQHPAGLELTVPHDDESSAAMVTLNGAAYAMDLQSSLPVLGSHKFWKNHFAVVGKVGGQPVSCSATFVLEGYRYVAFVATHPEHQRRGYADAAMRRSLENAAAARGKCPTVLHATDAGCPVYEKMGYASISTHNLFIEEKFLSGH